ncbi:carboxypeptidase-like regulatory domain-containing protein [Cohnella rhizosphaerae]|uniref:Carboxypeptidase-like regulatory domain-containing protein n=1 Tax=Cohnella rhizosphaerae TaxID=1457232 RepID=A0A9X4QVZ2_9BACL|nr:carboxypeptidase-like regulatory domain-containing protein [Cohnella rhizosphaerae]MDG0812953.1 carboxypeptidase-like regulatory domain-containing protein [Cohnella rhizosphaerae]
MSAASTFVSRCSLVVYPIDAWTGRALAGADVVVRLEGLPHKPLRTADGGFAFMDVQAAACSLTVSAPMRLASRRDVDLTALPARSPVVVAPLLPGSRLAAPPGATGLALLAVGADGKPVPDLDIYAWIEEESCVRGRLADELPAGSDKLRCASEGGRLLPGDHFILMERGGKAKERCRAGPDTGQPGLLSLEAPAMRDWRRGALLLPAAEARTDREGAATLALRGAYPQRFRVHAELALGKKRTRAEWTASGGTVTPQARIEWPAG